jgi:hypothetical protein
MCNFRGGNQIKNQFINYNYLCKWAKVETPINNSSNLIIFWNQMNSNVQKCYEIEEHEDCEQYIIFSKNGVHLCKEDQCWQNECHLLSRHLINMSEITLIWHRLYMV